jgi:hypothetical protein
MEPSFAKLLAGLADHDVRFLIVGGVAVTLHGYVRLTEDLDILLDPVEENITRFLGYMVGFGEGFARELCVDDFDDAEGAVRIVEASEQIQLDVFTRMSGVHYSDVISDADILELGTRMIRYASKASLIRWNEGSVREKDRLDAMALRQLTANPQAFD